MNGHSGSEADGDDGVHGGAGGEQQTAEPGDRAEHRGENGGDAQAKNEIPGDDMADVVTTCTRRSMIVAAGDGVRRGVRCLVPCPICCWLR